MSDSSHRTLVCSVLFLDIEGYSKGSVSDQLLQKQQFNTLLMGALRHVATDDRIVLDTGDGAAICFLSDPEDSLFAAMSLRDALAATDPNQISPLHVRIGIHLGPVRLLKDINGQINIIGDGINDAQRVMSFSEPGKIMVSRSYFEVVSRLSNDYAKLFIFDGIRTDKHVREHSVYTIGSGTLEPPRRVADKEAVQPIAQAQPSRKQSATTWIQNTSHGGRMWTFLAVAILLGCIGFGVFWFGRDSAPKDAISKEKAGSTPVSKEKAGSTPVSKEKAGSTPDWLIEMRKGLKACRKQGGSFICVEQIRWKYCAPSNWDKFEECSTHKGAGSAERF